jgi:DNA topoisomerase I
MRIMIVESPTKAKKISTILGSEWIVKASFGHVDDLPGRELAVAPHTYALTYVLSERGQEIINVLSPLVKKADEIYLATDPDREGEVIADHLRLALNIRSYKRVTFNEITETAVRSAIGSPRQMDINLVHAAEARRAMDRLIGFKVSPPLSSNAGSKLSAGRCQSPAVRLVVDRQIEIDNFKTTNHFAARVTFDNWSADWKTKSFLAPDERYILDQSLADQAAACRLFTVIASSQAKQSKAPPAPFTTSTLLQMAGSSLGFSPAVTQQLAQKLFENGHITYHRTDSPNLSQDGITAIVNFATTQGWPVAPAPRRWPVPQGAQEAHEAIRPTHFEEQVAGEDENQQALYRLIRTRAIACQLADAQYNTITVDLVCENQGKQFEFQARSSILVDKGWKIVTETAGDDGDEDDQGDDQQPDSGNVPVLEKDSTVAATNGERLERATKPPVRYTESTLIRTLEHKGIGRPSTFAAIVKNICDREYVTVSKRFLVPGPAGYAIVKGLSGQFSFMDYDYTKELEKRLDMIADGNEQYLSVVSDLDKKLDEELNGLAQLAPHFPCPSCGKALHRINGKHGAFWGCSGYNEGCKIICTDIDGKPGPVSEHSDNPSEKALAYAQSLAEKSKLELTPETLASAKLLRVWMDEAIKITPPTPASDKQKALVKIIVEKNNLQMSDEALNGLTMAKASAFIDEHWGKTGTKTKPASRAKSASQPNDRVRKRR